MTVAIKIENLSKQYRLGLVSTHTLRHDLNRWWVMNIQRKEDPNLIIGDINDRSKRAESEYVWALKDINLEIHQGEVLGIIGKNGAGKSTLLKILSNVTSPTTGVVKTKGRVASLLEVGTGFHPEMTGRENIFLNGSILGMTKKEIAEKFDEIVDFSGVERYIDTPVKRYSSGMLVRLGFAVAAHLEPDILVVDEVLAVGDIEFQNKAIGKMQKISIGHGRTILFVSHNLSAIGDLCKNAVILKDGFIHKTGKVREIISTYLESSHKVDLIREWEQNDNAPGDQNIKIKRIFTINKDYVILRYCLTTEDFGIKIEYEVLCDVPYFTHGINLYNISGLHIFSSHDTNKYKPDKTISRGIYSTIVWIPGNMLQEGEYLLSLALMRYNPFFVLFEEKDLIRINIIDTIVQSAKSEFCNLDFPGIIRPKLSWEYRKLIKQTL